VFKTLAALCTALLLSAGAVSAAAEVERDLYAATVPVADQGARALAAGAADALAEVLIKVSGSDEVLRNPAIAEALQGARSQVQQYAYRRTPGDDALFARFEFDPAYVTGLVVQAGAPLWTANRPPVLAWVVAEGPRGRFFVNPETAPEEAALLLEEFSRRGVPVQLPLFDLADTAAIDPEDVWRLDGIVLRSASARYNVQHIAAGRMVTLSTGAIAGDWSYFSQRDRLDRSINAPDLRGFLRRGVALVADEMAGRYAVAATAAEDSGAGVLLSVTGVTAFADYARLVNWLESLELVNRANVERVSGDRLELRINARADAAQLATLIELNERLEPSPQPVGDAALRYRWRN